MSEQNDKFFITPDGDAFVSLIIGGNDHKGTHHISAASVLKALDDAEFWRKACGEADKQLERERERIARLMKALSDEVTGTVAHG